MGQLRSTDNGQPIDTSSSYPFAEGVLGYSGAVELMQLMADGKQAHACYAKKITSYALQRDVVESDLQLLDALSAVSMSASGSIKATMLELAKNPAFTIRAGGAP
jgi:hypothetical protein